MFLDLKFPIQTIYSKYHNLYSMNQKGSILLYVIFLVSFLVLFFASFQGEVQKVLDGANSFEKGILEQSKLDDILASLRGKQVASVDITDTLKLVASDYSGTGFSLSLASDIPAEYRISATGSTTSLVVSVVAGAPIFHRLAVFNVGSEPSAIIYSSGIVSTSLSLTLSPTYNRHILYLEALGGYSKYSLTTGDATVLPSVSRYHLDRDINGYTKSEGNYEIINFTGGVSTGIDYGKLGMYLKQ